MPAVWLQNYSDGIKVIVRQVIWRFVGYNLRIIQEYSQPKIGRKIRIFSLGRKNNILIKKKRVYLIPHQLVLGHIVRKSSFLWCSGKNNKENNNFSSKSEHERIPSGRLVQYITACISDACGIFGPKRHRPKARILLYLDSAYSINDQRSMEWKEDYHSKCHCKNDKAAISPCQSRAFFLSDA